MPSNCYKFNKQTRNCLKDKDMFIVSSCQIKEIRNLSLRSFYYNPYSNCKRMCLQCLICSVVPMFVCMSVFITFLDRIESVD